MVSCPICDKEVKEANINPHIDSGCEILIEDSVPADGGDAPPHAAEKDGVKVASIFQSRESRRASDQAAQAQPTPSKPSATPSVVSGGLGGSKYASDTSTLGGIKRPFGGGHTGSASKRVLTGPATPIAGGRSQHPVQPAPSSKPQPPTTPHAHPPTGTTQTSAAEPQASTGPTKPSTNGPAPTAGIKRSRDDDDNENTISPRDSAVPKRVKTSAAHNLEKAAPLADRLRPRTLDDVRGQALVGADGVLRALVAQDRVPSMILWGGPGTGKTTIARIVAHQSGARFVEINSTSTGVAECKRLFGEARGELSLTGRKTILFCDEIHRFSKAQQDVFLGPVEAGQVTLIGATTENPSFRVINALLSRCRVFTLSPLPEADLLVILRRGRDALDTSPSPLLDDAFLSYLAAFATGDARTALNLLELAAATASSNPALTPDELRSALTQTHVYDRAGDAHYDTISALHKSVRGSDPDAALYWLARMLAAGEDPLFIARRLVVAASEDVGLADNTMLPLAVAAHAAAERVGMPEARIPLAHCAVALALAPKSTRAYRGLAAAMRAIDAEPAVAGLPVPLHLRNAPTRLLRELGAGGGYKYNPDYRGGRVRQDYLPDRLRGRRFLGDDDLGDKVDPDLEENGAGVTGEGDGVKVEGEQLEET